MINNHSQVDIPLVFFFCAFCIVIFGLFFKLSSSNKQEINKMNIPISIAPVVSNIMKSTNTLDYNNPISCSLQTKEASISASLMAASISATVINNTLTNKYIIQGDCLYSWTSKGRVGIKKCGVGTYIPLAKQLLNSNVVSVDSLVAMIPKSPLLSGIDIPAVLSTCKNNTEIKKDFFLLPKDISFKEN